MQGRNVRFAPVVLSDARQARLRRLYPRATAKAAIRTLLVPVPDPGGNRLGASKPVEDEDMFNFVEQVLDSVFLASLGS